MIQDVARPPRPEPTHRPALTGLPKPTYTEVHAFWLAGMSCDGCTIAVSGATQPSLEDLLAGTVPGLPKVVLHHPVLAVEAGADFTAWYYKAWRRELEAPFVIIVEGSVPDQTLAGPAGGYWAGLGAEPAARHDAAATLPADREAGEGADGFRAGGSGAGGSGAGGSGADGSGQDGAGHDPWAEQPVSINEWIERLAPGAAAAIAIGTCATWGGVPAAAGNVTGSMSLLDFVGEEYRSGLGLPVINIPGCSPTGDNFTETVAAILHFLQGTGPLPEFDELGRPAWLFGETVHRGCTRGGYYEEGVFAKQYGDRECLVDIGCWGPVVQCNIVSRGAINHVGGCMKAGGVCIGCTMPGFPDKFSPFYKAPPGSDVSGRVSRLSGSFIRPLRRLSQRQLNLEPRWKKSSPAAWSKIDQPTMLDNITHYFYEKLQFAGATRPGSGAADAGRASGTRRRSGEPASPESVSNTGRGAGRGEPPPDRRPPDGEGRDS
jgi:hydrogenase small subunit